MKSSEPTASAEEKKHEADAKPSQNKNATPPVIGTSKLVKLVAPDTIDVQSRLADVIPRIEFRDMPFARAIGLAASLSGLPITIDPEAMIRLGVSLRDPISVRLSGATVEEALQEIVAKRGMVFTAEDGQILVTAPADQDDILRRVRYTVSDLAGGDKGGMDQLAAMVQNLVSPASWQAAGGEGIVETDKTALVVRQTAAVHDQILVFCEKLRKARSLPLKSNRDPKRFELSTRLQQAAAALSRKVTANFHEPATLVEILAYLGRQAEVDILLDRQALGADGDVGQVGNLFCRGESALGRRRLSELLDSVKTWIPGDRRPYAASEHATGAGCPAGIGVLSAGQDVGERRIGSGIDQAD